jgi:hypothetical protein
MEGGVLLKVSLKDDRNQSVIKQYYMFSSQDKCDAFIYDLFAKRLFTWARSKSDEWDEIQQKFGFKGRTDDKCLEILREPETLLALWEHYNGQLLAEGKDVWYWHANHKTTLDTKQAPIEIGPYHMDKDFY